MNSTAVPNQETYRNAMGQLLVLYTQVDQLIMEICAERIATAPDEVSQLGLAKQVGDECRHVQIQRAWMEQFSTDTSLVLSAEQQAVIRDHFRDLPWLEFLSDLYLCVEALGSEAVENVVPLADPGTRESLHVPLEDELEHVEFGISRLQEALSALPSEQRKQFIAKIPQRIDALTDQFYQMGFDIPAMFTAVGADYEQLCSAVSQRRDEVIGRLVA